MPTSDDEELSDGQISLLIEGKTIKSCDAIDTYDADYWKFVFTDESVLRLHYAWKVEYEEGEKVTE